MNYEELFGFKISENSKLVIFREKLQWNKLCSRRFLIELKCTDLTSLKHGKDKRLLQKYFYCSIQTLFRKSEIWLIELNKRKRITPTPPNTFWQNCKTSQFCRETNFEHQKCMKQRHKKKSFFFPALNAIKICSCQLFQ